MSPFVSVFVLALVVIPLAVYWLSRSKPMHSQQASTSADDLIAKYAAESGAQSVPLQQRFARVLRRRQVLAYGSSQICLAVELEPPAGECIVRNVVYLSGPATMNELALVEVGDRVSFQYTQARDDSIQLHRLHIVSMSDQQEAS